MGERIIKMFLTFIPYKEIGTLQFGASSETSIKIFGLPIAESKYGYPKKNKFAYDYGFFRILISENLVFEAIELFPDMADEEICLSYNEVNIVLSTDINTAIGNLKGVTDDLLLDDDGEGYTSKKLGLRIYCPDDIVEQVIIHDIDYYKV